jgi:UDP-glucose 4-epimerase
MILVSGARGRLARIVIEHLNEPVVGIDVRDAPPDFPGDFFKVKRYDHRKTAEVFRKVKPRVLLHLGVRSASPRMDQRYTDNVLGTRHMLGLCQRFGVERVVSISSFHVYGAHEHNPIGIREDAPLRAGARFPELIDLVEVDHTVSNFVWRQEEVSTVLLRPVHIVGPRLRNRASKLLTSEYVPRLIGFDPMLQFLHEEDAARAIVVAMRSPRRGVYNLAGEGTVAYSHAIRNAGGRPLPLPHVVARPFVRGFGRIKLSFPHYLVDYFRYPTIIDDSAFRRDFRWEPTVSTVDALRSLRAV